MATNSTRLFFAGFNLYGQIGQGCTSSLAESFIDFPQEKGLEIEMTHSFAIVWKPSKINIQGPKTTLTNQTPLINFPSSSSQLISQVACSDQRILILCENGDFYKVDMKDEGLLQPILLPKLSLDSDGDKIERIACGSNINIAASRCGVIFNIPNKLEAIISDIVDICCGREHCVILDKNGCVWTFGRGSRGQLGHGNLGDLQEPKLVEALAGLKIIQISAGGWHSCALSEFGDIYTWGWNGNGQLGYEQEKNVSVMATPTVVDVGSLDVSVRKVACGGRHTIALLDNGELRGAGWNKYSQLGIVSAEENCYGMRLLNSFADKKVTDVRCGPWSSLVFVDE